VSEDGGPLADARAADVALVAAERLNAARISATIPRPVPAERAV
jgi:hypothetical protein